MEFLHLTQLPPSFAFIFLHFQSQISFINLQLFLILAAIAVSHNFSGHAFKFLQQHQTGSFWTFRCTIVSNCTWLFWRRRIKSSDILCTSINYNKSRQLRFEPPSATKMSKLCFDFNTMCILFGEMEQ